MPPLVFAGEARTLREHACARVAEGNGFLLHAGDCAESFAEFSADNIRDKLKVILQMSVVLTYSTGVPTLKVGRIAGPVRQAPLGADRDSATASSCRRSSATSSTTSRSTAAARRPDPQRMVRGYHQAAATLNLLRAFTKGGFADLNAACTSGTSSSSRAGAKAGATTSSRDGDRPRAAVHGRVRHRPRRRGAAPRGRLLHVARGAAPRLRGGAHPARQPHRRLVRLLRAPAVDRRPHPPARRRARRVPLRRAEPDRREARARRRRPTRSVALCRRLDPGARARAGSRS